MEIKTNMPDEFREELEALFAKYGIRGANGWDDGSLILYLINSDLIPPHGGPHFWVEFHETSEVKE